MHKTVDMIVDQLGNFIFYMVCIFLFWSANVTFSTKTTNVSKSLTEEKNNFNFQFLIVRAQLLVMTWHPGPESPVLFSLVKQ